nr:type I restriction-modification enzyme R subunit C-terminal domain-containing protein [Rhodomicrobium vannielii]
MDPNGKQLRVVRYTDYAAESVRSIAPTATDLRSRWADAEKRREIITALAERGIDFSELAEQTGQSEADPFDLLCHLAFNAPLRTRRERAQRLKQERQDYFDKFSPEARQVLDELLEKYAQHGYAQFVLPDVLYLQPISTHGKPRDHQAFRWTRRAAASRKRPPRTALWHELNRTVPMAHL